MIRSRTLKITAIVLALLVGLTSIAGWDIVFDRSFRDEYPRHIDFF